VLFDLPTGPGLRVDTASALRQGGDSGPAVKPVALRVVYEAAQAACPGARLREAERAPDDGVVGAELLPDALWRLRATSSPWL
jgi:hypothetical protein